jgi:hypothetical protein
VGAGPFGIRWSADQSVCQRQARPKGIGHGQLAAHIQPIGLSPCTRCTKELEGEKAGPGAGRPVPTECRPGPAAGSSSPNGTDLRTRPKPHPLHGKPPIEVLVPDTSRGGRAKRAPLTPLTPPSTGSSRSSKRNPIACSAVCGAPSARVLLVASSSTPAGCLLQLKHGLDEGARGAKSQRKK